MFKNGYCVDHYRQYSGVESKSIGSGGGLKTLSESELKTYNSIVRKPMMEQAKTFLHSFVLQFPGEFDEILRLADDFRKYTVQGDKQTVFELEEVEVHHFLEDFSHAAGRGEKNFWTKEPPTATTFRNFMKITDLDANGRVSFIEYALMVYNESEGPLKKRGVNVKNLVTPSGPVNPELLKLLEEAIAEFEKVLKEEAEHAAKIASLQRVADTGGVRGKAAANEIEQIQSADKLARNKSKITAEARKRKAERLIREDDGSAQRAKALEEETERLRQQAEEKKRVESEKKAASQSRLKAKAAMFSA